MSDNVIKIIPNELNGNSRYAIRVRSVNSFGAVSDWSESLIMDTDDASAPNGGRLVLTANGMIAYDEKGQTSFVYSGEGSSIRTNLVTNPSFEINTTGWTATVGTSISRITTDFYVGETGYKASLKVTSIAASTDNVGILTLNSDRVTVTPGDLYTVSAFVKALVNKVTLKIGLVYYSGSGSIIRTDYNLSPRVVEANGLWTRISSAGMKIPNGTSKLGVVIISSDAMIANQSYLIDGILLESGSTLGDYFDGSTSIGATKWSGVAHASTSTFDLSASYFVDGGVFTSGTVQTAVDVGLPYLPATPQYGKPGVKMSIAGIQGYSGDQATPSFSLDTQGKFRVGNFTKYMYWDGAKLTVKGSIDALDFNLLNNLDQTIASLGPASFSISSSGGSAPNAGVISGSTSVAFYNYGLNLINLDPDFTDSGMAWSQGDATSQNMVLYGPNSALNVVASTTPYIYYGRETAIGSNKSYIRMQPSEIQYLVGADTYKSSGYFSNTTQANTSDVSDTGFNKVDIQSWSIPPTGVAGGSYNRIFMNSDSVTPGNRYILFNSATKSSADLWSTTQTWRFMTPLFIQDSTTDPTGFTVFQQYPSFINLKRQNTSGSQQNEVYLDASKVLFKYTASASENGFVDIGAGSSSLYYTSGANVGIIDVYPTQLDLGVNNSIKVRITGTTTTTYNLITANAGMVLLGTNYIYNGTATGNWLRPYDGTNFHLRAASGSMYLDTDGNWYFRSIAGVERMTITSGGVVSASYGFYGYSKIYQTSNGAVANAIRADAYAADGTWAGQPFLNYAGAGVYAGVQAGIALHAYSVAPYWRSISSSGDRMDCINSDGSAYGRVAASGYDTISSIRFKEEVTETDDDELLQRMSQVKAHRFKFKVRPQSLTPSDKFKTVNEKWMAKGKPHLRLDPHNFVSKDHDCADDRCNGTPESPCNITLNDTHTFGLIAEHVHEVLPEVSWVDSNNIPEAIDISQISTMAFGGVGALYRKIQELTNRINALEKKK